MPTTQPAKFALGALCLFSLTLAGCGGDTVTAVTNAVANSGASPSSGASSSSGAAPDTTSGSSSSSGSSSTTSASSSGGAAASSSSGAGSGAASGSGPAARLASKLRAPSRLLIGLGAQQAGSPVSDIESEALHPDIIEQYLNGVGAGDWTTWNSPSGYIVQLFTDQASSLGAIPMFTLYQMAANGEGNLSGLNSAIFMAAYWINVRILFQQIAITGKPTLVNLEPDFWGEAEKQASNGDPASVFANVQINPDCASLTNDVTGVAGCLIAMAHKYAANAYIGFPPSIWGGNTVADVVQFMNAVGAQNADFIIEQTLDRDAGCYEADPSYCTGKPTSQYWDETNTTHPNFEDYFAELAALQTGIGNLPVILWQTPEGVPSSTPGGTPGYYRDNRVHYFLTHPGELTAIGTLGVVFSDGADYQTSIVTDGGQFQALDAAYLAAPAALP